MVPIVLISAALFVVAGCAPAIVDITKTSKGVEERTDPNEVDILATKPDRRYTELATVAATGFDVGDTAKMHNAIRAKASALGANAVLITNSGINIDPAWGTREMWCTGVAIKY